ncbi:hypothetical protein [Spartinivicinus poritis]|uniref:Solute-binding protein family 3/N-terminal domain-containing protein n=1 Tax=Spartinivicinus poritis TaxID=2994640 RepID=A0ABT5UH80_9GAMM|nr:hypothetical protein [Spartinivicinus sp. A2-2]MDE1465726.1 hypothetical protein [Spartinivicinus sp. A2-2]
MRSSLLVLGFCFAQQCVSEELKLTTQHWPPYQMKEQGIVSGLATDVLRCVFKKMNQSFSITILPWERAQTMVQEGFYHGFYSASQSKSRDQFAIKSTSIA